MPRYHCHYCEEQPFFARAQRLLLHYVKLVHSQEPGFSISCDYCHWVFRNVWTTKTTFCPIRTVLNMIR